MSKLKYRIAGWIWDHFKAIREIALEDDEIYDKITDELDFNYLNYLRYR